MKRSAMIRQVSTFSDPSLYMPVLTWRVTYYRVAERTSGPSMIVELETLERLAPLIWVVGTAVPLGSV